MRTDTPKTIYLKHYEKPHYLVPQLDMVFRVFDEHTLVKAVQTLVRAPHAPDGSDIVLDGEHLVLKSVMLDGVLLDEGDGYDVDTKSLRIKAPAGKDRFTLEIETEIDPAANTRLEGLYKSGGNWCTQCEAEGFRTITYFQDRPDVMSVFTVRIEADKKTCPVLLSNGNPAGQGDLEGGRHYTVWHDPFPKPCYLFALVAGDLVHIEDHFKTMSGRDVTLRIYVREGDQDQCGHAMESLKHSMRWDEEKYGREYELDLFNIVAVSDFNMGAMENTSLNIFNTALVLAHPETATDADFERVESVIAHEYFHNWTGNRVTCRDWFQLSLKEGLTVFRDQEFSADMNSRGVKRIDDVALLRRMQFAEDAGPLAHPVRPDNYIEINNFYTVTVYEKGAELIRMQYNLLGDETYRKATDLYFERHDGQAVTCEDFVKCMEDASGRDLSQFFLWYKQAGTPVINAAGRYDESQQRYVLTLRQSLADTPGQTGKKPMHIPVLVSLVGNDGTDLAEAMLELREESQDFVFENIPHKPVPSILRGFSAPVKLESDLTDDDYRFLMVHDSDGFNRWEAGQKLGLSVINRMMAGADVPSSYLESYGALLDYALTPGVDKALMARALRVPDIHAIAQTQDIVDPSKIHETRNRLLDALHDRYADRLQQLYDANHDEGAFSPDAAAMGRRALKNHALSMLVHKRRKTDAVLCKAQYDSATNMTDRMAAFLALAGIDSPERDAAIADFYARFRQYQLVIDKWFAAQLLPVREDTIHIANSLKAHEDFTMKNPNRVRSLYGALCMNNPVAFHHPDGHGYDFLATAVMELNEINPQIAARLLTPLREWRRYTPDRQAKMQGALEKIAALPGLSPDVYEIVTKSLKAA